MTGLRRDEAATPGQGADRHLRHRPRPREGEPARDLDRPRRRGLRPRPRPPGAPARRPGLRVDRLLAVHPPRRRGRVRPAPAAGPAPTRSSAASTASSRLSRAAPSVDAGEHGRMPVHDVAATRVRPGRRRSTSGPARRTRPTRSRGSSSTCGSARGTRVADLAAGTGKLTRLLTVRRRARRGRARSPGCDRRSPRCVPGVPAGRGDRRSSSRSPARRSTRSPSRRRSTGSTRPVALAELARVLRAGRAARTHLERAGSLASTGSTSSGRSWTGSRSERRGATTSAGATPRSSSVPTSARCPRRRSVTRRCSPATGSSTASGPSATWRCCPADERERVLDEVRDVLDTHPSTPAGTQVAIPYRVDAYWCERR